MMFKSLLIVALATLADCQAVTHIVNVGADGFNFSPSQLSAGIGDIIEFQFYPVNHSVARAAFGVQPCIPYEYSGLDRTGFYSGFKPVTIVYNLPTWTVTVNDTEPIFFYCGAPDACLQGMIGVINPNATMTFEQQLAYTQNTTLEFVPGEGYPKEGIDPTSITRTTTATGVTSTPTGLATSPPATSATTTSSPTANSAPIAAQSHSLSKGAIVGVAIGAVVIALLAGALIWMCARQRAVKELEKRMGPAHSAYPPSSGPPEGYYNNVQKPVMRDSGRFSGQTYNSPAETESYRSRSPPIEERTGMIGRNVAASSNQSPTSERVVSPGYTSPTHFKDQETEIAYAAAGLRPYNQPEPPLIIPRTNSKGPHEMLANPAKHNESVEVRAFSYTDSDNGGRD